MEVESGGKMPLKSEGEYCERTACHCSLHHSLVHPHKLLRIAQRLACGERKERGR